MKGTNFDDLSKKHTSNQDAPIFKGSGNYITYSLPPNLSTYTHWKKLDTETSSTLYRM